MNPYKKTAVDLNAISLRMGAFFMGSNSGRRPKINVSPTGERQTIKTKKNFDGRYFTTPDNQAVPVRRDNSGKPQVFSQMIDAAASIICMGQGVSLGRVMGLLPDLWNSGPSGRESCRVAGFHW